MHEKEITTSRLLLRMFTLDDVEDIYQIFASDALMIPYGMNRITSLDKAKKLLEAMIEDDEWAIVDKKHKQVIGTIGFVGWKTQHKRAEIAFALKQDYWLQGYMNESLEAVLKFFFEKTSMNRLEAFVYPSNTNSIKLLEHQGFVKEGYLREHSIKRGHLEDYLLYAILRKDYYTHNNQKNG